MRTRNQTKDSAMFFTWYAARLVMLDKLMYMALLGESEHRALLDGRLPLEDRPLSN